MSHINAMKQIGGKGLGFKIEIMEWSNKMDLIAIGNEKGEVIVQRLNWQRIFTFPSLGEDIKIRTLSWQPDETIIAIAYSNGKVCLIDVEKEDEIYSFTVESDVRTLHWTRSVHPSKFSDSYTSTSPISNEDFLTPLPNLSSLSSGDKKNGYGTKNFTKGSLNFLVISLKTGKVCLSVLGMLQCGSILITNYLKCPENYEIYDVRMNYNFDKIITYVRDGNELKIIILKNEILSKYTSSLLNLAMKHAHILECFNYIDDTIQCITEAWESVLLEMDNKLSKYVNSQPEGSLSADFLELLMFGNPSDALDQFLTRDLTEKGLKKLGNSIELSYSTIQNLVVRPLHTVAIHIFYHLNILKGLSRNTYCYEPLISLETAENALNAAGSFLLKVSELQQTVVQSVNDYKVFWCWLCVIVVRLMEENVPDEVASVTQEDIIYLAEFLNNFDDCIYEKEDGTFGKKKFNLERVGQYLVNANLEFPPKIDIVHQWNRLLIENECLRESKLLFSYHNNFSLIQERNNLQSQVNEFFSKPNKVITDSFILKSTIKCYEFLNELNFSMNSILTSFLVDENTKSDLLATVVNEKELIFTELNSKMEIIKSIRITFDCGPVTNTKFKMYTDLRYRSIQFYNESVLSILLECVFEGKISNYFLQLPVDLVREKCSSHQYFEQIDLNTSVTNKYSLFDIIDTNAMKLIDGFPCSSIAVSGSRKVASLLSNSCKKVRIYEMEVEDDDDEVDMSQNSALDNSKESMQSQD